MTVEQIEEKIPALLDVLRSVQLSPELEEVREHLFSSTWQKSKLEPQSEPPIVGSVYQFQPVPIRGEPGSVTLLRDRGEY